MTFILALLLAAAGAEAIEKVPPQADAISLVNKFMTALRLPDEAERVRAVLPFVHKSLKTNDGKHLTRNVRQYSFQKASQSVHLYRSPVVVTEVHKGKSLQVGYKQTAERGRKDKYFVATKDGKVGRPAPIHVFFPDGGGAPKVFDFGSL